MIFHFAIPQTADGTASFAAGRRQAASAIIQIERAANNSVAESFMAPSDAVTQSCPVLPPPPVEAWTAKEERRFDKLAELHALGRATTAEVHELKSLVKARSVLVAPVSSTEILRMIQSRKLTGELMDVLNRYVEFHHPKADSRS